MKRFIILMLIVSLFPAVTLAAEVLAQVSTVSGSARFKPTGNAKWYPLRKGLRLKEGDLLQTGAGGKIVLLVESSVYSVVGPGSQVTISALERDRRDKLTLEYDIGEKGMVHTTAEKINKLRKVDIKIYTPSIVAGVRGTDFSVVVPDADTALVAVFKGRVVVSDFVAEQGLATDDNEMMMDFLDEMQLDPGMAQVFKKGKKVSEDEKQLGDFRLEEYKKELAALNQELKALEKSANNQDSEIQKANAIRETALKTAIDP